MNELKKMTHVQKIKPAIDRIRDNLEYFVKKEYDEFLKRSTRNSGSVKSKRGEYIIFPSVKETLAWLMRKGEISQTRYESIKYKIKNKQKEQDEIRRNMK